MTFSCKPTPQRLGQNVDIEWEQRAQWSGCLSRSWLFFCLQHHTDEKNNWQKISFPFFLQLFFCFSGKVSPRDFIVFFFFFFTLICISASPKKKNIWNVRRKSENIFLFFCNEGNFKFSDFFFCTPKFFFLNFTVFDIKVRAFFFFFSGKVFYSFFWLVVFIASEIRTLMDQTFKCHKCWRIEKISNRKKKSIRADTPTPSTNWWKSSNKNWDVKSTFTSILKTRFSIIMWGIIKFLITNKQIHSSIWFVTREDNKWTTIVQWNIPKVESNMCSIYEFGDVRRMLVKTINCIIMLRL